MSILHAQDTMASLYKVLLIWVFFLKVLPFRSDVFLYVFVYVSISVAHTKCFFHFMAIGTWIFSSDVEQVFGVEFLFV